MQHKQVAFGCALRIHNRYSRGCQKMFRDYCCLYPYVCPIKNFHLLINQLAFSRVDLCMRILKAAPIKMQSLSILLALKYEKYTLHGMSDMCTPHSYQYFVFCPQLGSPLKCGALQVDRTTYHKFLNPQHTLPSYVHSLLHLKNLASL